VDELAEHARRGEPSERLAARARDGLAKLLSAVCAKPRPGMLVRLLDSARVTPGRALAIGNAAIDRRAAKRADVRYMDMNEFFGQKKVLGAVKRMTEAITPA